MYFFSNASPLDMMTYYSRVYDRFDKERFHRLMKSFCLDEKRRIHTFSKGMKKQVSVICGICANTEYLFCDETFDGLDPVMRQAVKSIFAADMEDIARQVSLTSPAVSERIRRMEKTGVIAGYTVVLGDAEPKSHIDALISISVAPADRQYFITMVENQPGVAQCFHVTGSHSFIVKVSCAGIHELEHLINRFQKLGQTSTQIILSAPVDRRFTLDVHEHGKDPV